MMARRVVITRPVLETVRPLDHVGAPGLALPKIGSGAERRMDGLRAQEDALDRESAREQEVAKRREKGLDRRGPIGFGDELLICLFRSTAPCHHDDSGSLLR